MLLVDWQIKELIQKGIVGIVPYDESQIQPNSLDVKLGNEFKRYVPSNRTIDPYQKSTICDGIETKIVKYVDIHPNEFYLAETVERIRLPENVVAMIEGKSSLARLGITIHQTGGWIDAGFEGSITLELANLNPRPVRLYAGMPIGQIVFYETEPADVPYGKKNGAKYQNQIGPVVSRFYQNRMVV